MKIEIDMKTDIFSYVDYRVFLKDFTQELKNKKSFNLRAFAKKANIKAPGYLKLVIEAKRNLTDETAKKFARALELKGKELKYFLNLVTYNQTKDPDVKKKCFDKIIKLRPRSHDFLKEKKMNRYFSRHYYVTIREMVVLKDFKEDYKWIAKRCFPKISPTEAKKAVKTLLELGLLKRNECGNLEQTESFVQTQDKQNQLAETYQYHEAVLDKARHALGTLPQEERNYYALTLPLPEDMYDDIISEYYAFRDKIVKMVNDRGGKFDEVYQVNFQLFPVTKKKK